MALDLQSLRTMSADISRFTLSSDGDIQRKGFAHRLKSFFGNRAARNENAQTIATIRQAILSEKNYFADSVKQRGLQLINAVRTDRAINATQIRSIIAELDRMSGPAERKAAQVQRITAHFANPDHHAPACFQGHENKWRTFQTILRERLTLEEPQGGFGSQDFAGEIAQYEQAIQDIFDGIADVEGGVDEMWGVFERGGFRRSSAGIRDIADLQAIAANVRSALDEAKALSAAHGEHVGEAVLQTMRFMQKPFPAGSSTKIVNVARSLPMMGLDRLTAQSSVAEIHKAIAGFTNKLCTYDFSGSGFGLGGPDEYGAAGMLLTRTAIDALPEETKRNILAALSTEGGQNLLAFYETQTMSADGINIISMISRMTENLKSSLGMENPLEPLPRPTDPDLSKIPLDIRTSYMVTEIVSGASAMPGKLGITRFDGRIQELRDKMNAFATAQQMLNIASQLSQEFAAPSENSVFVKDLKRTLKVRMPDGNLLANGSEAAAKAGMDAIVRFITGDANATFENASSADKIKARVVMAAMNQSCNAITLNAFTQSLNPNPTAKLPPFMIAERANTRAEEYALGRDDQGNITITMKYKAGAEFLSIPKPKTTEHVRLDEGSYIEYEMTTKIPAENLDKLAQADWGKLDCGSVRVGENGSYMGVFDAGNRLPEEYRFTGTTTTLIHVHLNPAQ